MSFIVIDGVEGAGKTTLIQKLKLALPKAIFTREPGGTRYAEQIRELILSGDSEPSPSTLFFLAWAARTDHMDTLISPALGKGKTVICDRFDSSTFAYQVRNLKGKNLEPMFWHTRGEVIKKKPDLYIFLDIDPEMSMKRVLSRKDDNYFDRQGIEFHKRIRKAFHEFSHHVPSVIIDASKSAESVYMDVLAQISKIR